MLAFIATISLSTPAHAQAGTGKAPVKRPNVASAKPAAAAPVDGARVFSTTCVACHQVNGEGLEDKYPPLAGSEWATGDDAKLVRILLGGLTGPVEVAGETFNGVMPGWGPTLKDPEIAAVATYIRSTWGNKAPPVTVATVAAIRAGTKKRTTPWTVAELASVITVKK